LSKEYLGKICKDETEKIGLVTKHKVGAAGFTYCSGFDLLNGGHWQSYYPKIIYNSLNEYINAKINEAIYEHKELWHSLNE